MNISRKQNVILINNDIAQSKHIADAIADENINLISIHQGVEALEYIRYSDRPDLAIIDLHMTDIDGWRLCRLFRSPEFSSTNKTPILVTSSIYSGVDVREISRDLGANDFLTLPCEPSILRTAVQNLLSGQSIILKPIALIVDDNAGVAATLQRGLKSHGYETFIAQNAKEALLLFKEKKPSAIFMDHHLPDVYGTDLLSVFKQPGTDIVVIIITGDTSADLALEYTRLGADAFVHKPFDIRYLISLLSKAQRQRALLRVEELLAERTRDLRESDAKILQAAKLASIGELAAGVAHEINNPINGIMNCADIITEEFKPGSKNRQFAEMIKSESERVSTIVRRMLNFSREEQEEPIICSIGEIVDQSLVLMNSQISKSRIIIYVTIDDSIPHITCRKVQIQQVILNLLLNAVSSLNKRYPESSPDKVLQISAKIDTDNSDPSILITIEDHGTGIPAEQIPLIFNAFFTTKEAGTGLGLSISKSIVERHGGKVWAESKIDSYTRFYVSLPAGQAEQV